MTSTEPVSVGEITGYPPANVETQCVICIDGLEKEPQYTLPDCSHVFHQNCIMHWFRQGNSKCPLCNSLGIGGVCSNFPRRRWLERYRTLRQLSRRKAAPDLLKKQVAAIKKAETKLKALRKERRDFREKEGKFGELLRKYDRIQHRIYRVRSKIYNSKSGLGSGYIVPIIIAQKKTVG